MQKQTNSAPSVHTAPNFEILPLKIRKVSWISYEWQWVPLQWVSLKNLLFEQWINKWSYTVTTVKVNVNACTKLYIKL